MSTTLYLPMKKKWFDMVLSGEKKEEYRLFKPHWMTRIRKWIDENVQSDAVMHSSPPHGFELFVKVRGKDEKLPMVFFNGYKKDAPNFVGICDKVEIRNKAQHPEWGETDYDGKPHFVLHIGEVIKE